MNFCLMLHCFLHAKIGRDEIISESDIAALSLTRACIVELQLTSLCDPKEKLMFADCTMLK